MSDHTEPYDALETFMVAMDRQVADFRTLIGRGGRVLNLGAGKKQIDGAVSLDADMGWWAGEPMPFNNESVRTIYAFHFFEHLDKETMFATLRECQRVLQWAGTINIVVPHYSAEIAYQDLDHKQFFTEQTWTNLFDNKYYDGTMPRDWQLKLGFQMIMGIVQRNLVILSQLVKA